MKQKIIMYVMNDFYHLEESTLPETEIPIVIVSRNNNRLGSMLCDGIPEEGSEGYTKFVAELEDWIVENHK